jgi:hypothetical protein
LLTPSGDRVVLGNTVFDADSGKRLCTLPGHVGFSTISPDSRSFLYTYGPRAKLFALETGELLESLVAPFETIGGAISADNRRIAVGGIFKGVRVWELPSEDVAATWSVADRYTRRLCFGADGRRLVTGTDSGVIRLYDVDAGRELACLVLFDASEWVTITPEGYFIGSDNLAACAKWNIDGKPVEFDRYARDKLKKLIALFIGDVIRTEQEISWIQQTDLSPVCAAYPHLRHFRIRGGGGLSLGNIRLNELRSLAIESGGLSANVVRQVLQSDLPNLEHLEFWLGSDSYGGDATLEHLRSLIAGELFPRLKTLAIRNCRFADALAQAIADAPVMKRLDVLELSLGTLGDEGARVLLKSSSIRGLKKLDVHHHYISQAVVEELRALPIVVDASDRRETNPDDEYGDGPLGRYIAVSE